MNRIKNKDITDISNINRTLIEKCFNGEGDNYIFHFQLHDSYSYIGENLNGKHHGNGVVDTHEYVFVGQFDNGKIVNGTIHYKNDATHKCFIVDYKTVIHVRDCDLYMIHIYGVNSNDSCFIMSLSMNYDSLSIRTNAGYPKRLMESPRETLEMGLDYVEFSHPFVYCEDNKCYVLEQKVVTKIADSNLSTMYKNYTDYTYKPTMHIHLNNIIPDIVINPKIEKLDFIDSIYNNCMNTIGPQRVYEENYNYDEYEYNYYGQADGYKEVAHIDDYEEGEN